VVAWLNNLMRWGAACLLGSLIQHLSVAEVQEKQEETKEEKALEPSEASGAEKQKAGPTEEAAGAAEERKEEDSLPMASPRGVPRCAP